MNQPAYRFERPTAIDLIKNPTLSVAIVIPCRNGQERLDLLMASLAAQSYPKELVSVFVIDDGSSQPLKLPKISPKKSKLIRYKENDKTWGKTAVINDAVEKIKSDVLWFVDADMIFEKDHLAHHMKWHHDNDDYAVLGWKRFVAEWNYSASSVFDAISHGNFNQMHPQSWAKEGWEARVARTDDLIHPGLEGYRTFVGATFSIKNKLWKKLKGYRVQLRTGEDTELGWRLFMQGVRIVPERQALSWHLGYSTVEINKNQIDRHNQPSLANYIPEMKKIRALTQDSWFVPTYEVVIDVRNSKLDFLNRIRSQIVNMPGTQATYLLLANWSELSKRYSPTDDKYADLREIYNWTVGDNKFSFSQIGDENLLIEEIIAKFTDGPTPFHIYIDGDFDGEFDGKKLCDQIISTENGVVGVVTKQDKRAFAVFQPALARALVMNGSTYENIGKTWGVSWLTHESFMEIVKEGTDQLSRVVRFLKREGKKINSPRQLIIFTKKVFKIFIRKISR